MGRLALALAGVLVATAAWGEPVDPATLGTIATAAKGAGDPVVVHATAVPADVLLLALGTTDFVMAADARAIDGRLGADKGAQASAAFDALATGLDVVRLRRSRVRTAHPIDIAGHGAAAYEVLRILAEVSKASVVFAPQHEVPAITLRTVGGEPREVARAVAKLVGLELIESHGVWVFVEPGTKLDPKLAAVRHASSRLLVHHAHPGEARRLLEPDEPQDRNICPKDAWIDADLAGQTGVLDAVLATFSGPACEQQPSTSELDTATATLVGILIEPKLRRAVFRVPHGARAFEPGNDQRVEIGYVQLGGDRTATLHPSMERFGAVSDAPGPFEATDPHAWHLRGTVRVGTRWRAVFESRGEWRTAESPAEITAGTASFKQRAYALER